MAICEMCRESMLSATGCEAHTLAYADGEEHDAVPFGEETRYGDTDRAQPERPCHDCAAEPGEYHHPGCDVAECPRCERQLLQHHPALVSRFADLRDFCAALDQYADADADAPVGVAPR